MTVPTPLPAPAPLRWWERLARVAVAGLVGLTAWTMTLFSLDESRQLTGTWREPALALDLFVVGPILLVLAWWHRRLPLWVTAVVIALSGVLPMPVGPASLLLLSEATRRRWRVVAPLAGLTVVASVTTELLYPVNADEWPWWANVVVAVALTAILVGWGMYAGARRELLAQLKVRAEQTEADHARALADARQGERDRIAREMHDVLAHRLTQVSMHAGVLSYRTDLSPDAVRAEAETIRATAAAALDDLRSVLGLLRNTTGGTLAAPASADIGQLVEQARAAGQAVTLDGSHDVSGPVARHAYRIVQEALTNARRHAPDAPVEVQVRSEPQGLRVLVRNGPGGPSEGGGAGFGLVGLRERAALVGGTIAAGPTPDGGWLVTALLPVRPDDRADSPSRPATVTP